MKTVTIKLYEFTELTETSKQTALNNYRNTISEIFWADEIVDSVKALFEACNGIELIDYSLGERGSYVKIRFFEDAEELTGKRAIAWIENNLLSNLRIPYSKHNGERQRMAQYRAYYRPGMIKPCPFTGCCYDEDILGQLRADIKNGESLYYAFKNIADTAQRLISEEAENQSSDEYIEEFFQSNEYMFTANGKVW